MKYIKGYLAILVFSSLFCSFNLYANLQYDSVPESVENQLTAKININQATAEELAENLLGVGLNKAKKIIEYREKFGPFVSLEQLKEVSGIGQFVLDKNATKLSL